MVASTDSIVTVPVPVVRRKSTARPGIQADFASAGDPEALSPKELEILRLLAGGYSNKEISRAVHKSEGTVKNQVSAILGKLGVRDRTRAVLRAVELGLFAK